MSIMLKSVKTFNRYRPARARTTLSMPLKSLMISIRS